MASKLNDSQHGVLGLCAAFIEGIILQPTLYWKNARTVGLPFSLNPRIIYRGTAASICNEMQMMGSQFAQTSFFRHYFKGYFHQDVLLSSALAGAFSAILTSPIELVMIQQQKFGTSFFATPKQVFARYGLWSNGFFRGFSTCVCRDSIYVIGMLGATPFIQRYLSEKHDIPEFQASLYASLLGGTVAALPSHPFDTVKTCLQSDLEGIKYRTNWQTCQALYAEGGLRRFFSGGVWRTLNIIATVYIANECTIHLPAVLFKSD